MEIDNENQCTEMEEMIKSKIEQLGVAFQTHGVESNKQDDRLFGSTENAGESEAISINHHHAACDWENKEKQRWACECCGNSHTRQSLIVAALMLCGILFSAAFIPYLLDEYNDLDESWKGAYFFRLGNVLSLCVMDGLLLIVLCMGDRRQHYMHEIASKCIKEYSRQVDIARDIVKVDPHFFPTLLHMHTMYNASEQKKRDKLLSLLDRYHNVVKFTSSNMITWRSASGAHCRRYYGIANMLSDMFCDPLPLNARLELLREDQPDKVKEELTTAVKLAVDSYHAVASTGQLYNIPVQDARETFWAGFDPPAKGVTGEAARAAGLNGSSLWVHYHGDDHSGLSNTTDNLPDFAAKQKSLLSELQTKQGGVLQALGQLSRVDQRYASLEAEHKAVSERRHIDESSIGSSSAPGGADSTAQDELDKSLAKLDELKRKGMIETDEYKQLRKKELERFMMRQS